MSYGVIASQGNIDGGATGNSPYAIEALKDDPLVYLQFDETTGTIATDSSGNNHPGTYINSPSLGQYSVTSGNGKSALFDNSTTTKRTTSVPYGAWMDSAEITITFATIIVPGGLEIIASRYNEPGSDWSWFVYQNNQRFYFFYQAASGQTVSIDSGVTFTQGKRYYIAAYAGVGGSGIRIYDESGYIGGNTGAGYAVKSSSRALVIADAESANYATTMYIDDFCFNNVVLSTSRLDTLAQTAMQFRPKWVERSAGIAAHNGTTDHTLAFTPSSAGSLLVAIVATPANNTMVTPGWTKRLTSSGGSEVAVFSRNANAGDSSLTITHNTTDVNMAYVVYEFPSGSAWYSGNVLGNDSGIATISGLPGTPVTIFAGYGSNIDSNNSSPLQSFNSTWQYFMYEDTDEVNLYASGVEGVYLSAGYFNDFIGTSLNPTAPAVQFIAPGNGTVLGTAESVIFALTIPS